VIREPRSVRVSAARVLLAVERGHTTLAAELERARAGLADERDRALLAELTIGVLRWRNALDAILAAFRRRTDEEMAPQVRTVLRLGAYQLRYLDRLPPHAVVHESVESIRALGQGRASGFVNAVLRAMLRDSGKPHLPEAPSADAKRTDQVAFLTTTLSHPAWLVERWLDRYGFDAARRWCEFNNTVPDLVGRAAGSSTSGELLGAIEGAGVRATKGLWVRDAIRLAPGSLSSLTPELRDDFFIQEEASQIVAHTVGATRDERVLDTCAAPGGKTMVLAADMERTGLLVSGDLRPARVRLLSTLTRRAGVRSRIVALDLTRGLPFDAIFDRVLVDAPCSGLGTLRRDPDLKWSRTAADLARFARIQVQMLSQAARAIRPGGRLVYATCSSEPDENDDVVRTFLEQHSGFALGQADPGPRVPDGVRLVEETGLLRTLPFRDGLEAFFAAVLVRREAA